MHSISRYGQTSVFTLLLAAALLATGARANNVIVLNSGEATLSLIDDSTHQVVSTLPTGKEPHHLMATPGNESLIVANSVSNSLMFLDPTSWQDAAADRRNRRPVPDRLFARPQVVRLDRSAS